MKLLSQAVVNYLDVSDTVEKCDLYLNKVMVQIQELEGKFSEFDEYIESLMKKGKSCIIPLLARNSPLLIS